MAIPHANPIEPISVRPFGAQLTNTQTTTLVKTDSLELIRLVLPAGKEIDRHEVSGEITLQCLEGHVHIRGEKTECELTAGHLIYAPAFETHSLRAETDSSLLLTIMLRN
jgi:quercetin dioxygenase-like cupin family protein